MYYHRHIIIIVVVVVVVVVVIDGPYLRSSLMAHTAASIVAPHRNKTKQLRSPKTIAIGMQYDGQNHKPPCNGVLAINCAPAVAKNRGKSQKIAKQSKTAQTPQSWWRRGSHPPSPRKENRSKNCKIKNCRRPSRARPRRGRALPAVAVATVAVARARRGRSRSRDRDRPRDRPRDRHSDSPVTVTVTVATASSHGRGHRRDAQDGHERTGLALAHGRGQTMVWSRPWYGLP